MVGGGSFGREPGEWTDDTSMAIVIAEVAATGADLREEQALDALARRWHEWSQHAKDVGVQTRSVLSRAGAHGITARAARAESAELHKLTGRTAGNGSLMRTAPVALAYLEDEATLIEAARAVSELTHYDPEAGDACMLWCLAIRHAVLTGELHIRIGLRHIDPGRQELWATRLDAAESSRPSDFTNNGWLVEAPQAAWCAIATTPVPQDDPAKGVFRVDHLRLALDAAVRGGNDTDTVAAIAGGLLGRCPRGVSGPCGVASSAARLARDAHPRHRRPRVGNHPQRRPRRLRFQLQRVRNGRRRPASLRRGRLAGGHRCSAVAARRRRYGPVAMPGREGRPPTTH
jgi:ADP-ribosyl-[dinitrogen reductase] hydrolase